MAVLAEETERRIWAAYNARTGTPPAPKDLTAQLQADGHAVSLRSVERRYRKYAEAAAAYAATAGAARWRITDARDAEELALILPAVAKAAEDGYELSKDEAEILLAIRRALPARDLDLVLTLTRDYDRARRGEVDVFGDSWPDYTVDEIEDWVAFAHLDQTDPGVLEKAMDAGTLRQIGRYRVNLSMSLVDPLIHSCGRKFWSRDTYERHVKDCDGPSAQVAAAAQEAKRGRKGGTGNDTTRTR